LTNENTFIDRAPVNAVVGTGSLTEYILYKRARNNYYLTLPTK